MSEGASDWMMVVAVATPFLIPFVLVSLSMRQADREEKFKKEQKPEEEDAYHDW